MKRLHLLTASLILTATPGWAAGELDTVPDASTSEPAPPVVPQEPAKSNVLSELADMIRVGALLRMSFDVSGDDVFAVGPDQDDVAGVRFEDAQLWLAADVGPFDVYVMTNAANDDGPNYASAFPVPDAGGTRLSEGNLTSLHVLDAWARTELTQGLDVYAGQFKCPLVASANVDYDSLIMIDRTRIGQLFSTAGAYQPGAAVTYDNEQFHAKVAVQNGADGIVDDFGVVVRGEYKLNGGAAYREGALGAKEDLQATIGAAYFTDGSDIGGEDFGSSWAVDLYSTWNAISLQAEILGMDQELATRAIGASDDANPYDVTVGYRLSNDWEAAVRWQDLDNDADTTILGGGINYYITGHDLKLQFNVSNYDENGQDGTIFQLGLTVAVGDKPW